MNLYDLALRIDNNNYHMTFLGHYYSFSLCSGANGAAWATNKQYALQKSWDCPVLSHIFSFYWEIIDVDLSSRQGRQYSLSTLELHKLDFPKCTEGQSPQRLDDVQHVSISLNTQDTKFSFEQGVHCR